MQAPVADIRDGGGGAVIRIDEAIRALAEITDPIEIREHEIKAETMAQYFARTITDEIDSLKAQNRAVEYKLAAMRQGGRRLEEIGVAGQGGNRKSSGATTLDELGIEKERSRRWYNVKRIPDDCFEVMTAVLPELLTSDFLAAAKLGDATAEDCAVFLDDLRAATGNDGRRGNLVRALMSKLVRKTKHKKIHQAASLITPNIEGPYPLIYADPPWVFEAYSEMGKGRTPEQHYPTLTDEEIIDFRLSGKSVPEIAHNDAALLMWCTSSNIHRALVVLAGWGFTYKSQRVWSDNRSGDDESRDGRHLQVAQKRDRGDGRRKDDDQVLEEDQLSHRLSRSHIIGGVGRRRKPGIMSLAPVLKGRDGWAIQRTS